MVKFKAGRRNFLRGFVVAGGGVAISCITESTGAKNPPHQSSARQGSRGYRLTPHIREYYYKARF